MHKQVRSTQRGKQGGTTTGKQVIMKQRERELEQPALVKQGATPLTSVTRQQLVASSGSSFYRHPSRES